MKQLSHRPLTSSQVAALLGINRLTLLRWLKSGAVAEPELSARSGEHIRYRFFTEGDVERLRKYQKSLHPKGWRQAANAEHEPAGG